MMIEALNKKGYNAYAISIPSPKELLDIVALAAPVFVTMMAKVTYCSVPLLCLISFFVIFDESNILFFIS